jgi:hypothetical protein
MNDDTMDMSADIGDDMPLDGTDTDTGDVGDEPIDDGSLDAGDTY